MIVVKVRIVMMLPTSAETDQTKHVTQIVLKVSFATELPTNAGMKPGQNVHMTVQMAQFAMSAFCDRVANKCRNETFPTCTNDCPETAECDVVANLCRIRSSFHDNVFPSCFNACPKGAFCDRDGICRKVPSTEAPPMTTTQSTITQTTITPISSHSEPTSTMPPLSMTSASLNYGLNTTTFPVSTTTARKDPALSKSGLRPTMPSVITAPLTPTLGSFAPGIQMASLILNLLWIYTILCLKTFLKNIYAFDQYENNKIC
ncbi:hypothetical protein DdX_16762 [Ditylenchus destructor]|uniref:Uncharacterized protein n=1 Tax=Ditylenchus destructor TaxID=166010 RepID=A0AAD4MMV0_9BILA|nr:hypothetical protein DdX_16762 [Ditylenchus destructor]